MKKKHSVNLNLRIKRPKLNPKKVFVIVIFLIAQLIFFWSDTFRLKSVEIYGMNHLTGPSVLSHTNMPWGRHIWRINKELISSQITSISWVKSVVVQPCFPATIRIQLSERAPKIAIANDREPELFYGADADGKVLLKLSNQEALTLPKLILNKKIGIGATLEPDKISSVVSFAGHMPEDIRTSITQYRVDDGGYLSFTYRQDQNIFDVNFGALSNYERQEQLKKSVNTKMEIFLVMLKQLQNRIKDIEYIDLRYSEPVVKFRNLKRSSRTEGAV